MSNVLKYGSKDSIVRIAEHFPCRLLNPFPHQRFSQARERNLPLEKKKKQTQKIKNVILSFLTHIHLTYRMLLNLLHNNLPTRFRWCFHSGFAQRIRYRSSE